MKVRLWLSTVSAVMILFNGAALLTAQGSGCDVGDCSQNSDCDSDPDCDFCQANPFGPHCAKDTIIE